MTIPKLLLVTPPFTQLNTPYPATPYLKGYLTRKGFCVTQQDLSIELICKAFTSDYLERLFALKLPASVDANILRIHALRQRYQETIATVITFLQGKDTTLAPLICSADFLPRAQHLEAAAQTLGDSFGNLGIQDCAKYLCTLYLHDLSDYIRIVVTPHFELVRYAERLSVSLPAFDPLEEELQKPSNLLEELMLQLLENRIKIDDPDWIGFSIPFPGNLLAALRCGQYLKKQHPTIKIILGGGYPTTELRMLTDPKLFDYLDYIVLDDGELPLERLLSGEELLRTFTREAGRVIYHAGSGSTVSHAERGAPDFEGLPFEKYLSFTEITNPMHRLWSDGRWNKMMLAHGCYWAKCAFCDTALDYIARYDTVDIPTFVDWMERIITQTGSRGFHFVDEAAPPKLLKELALELIRRKLKVTWWGNIRFESAFTQDVCLLLAASGCIAVSGGLETASDRLLECMNKGITIQQATMVLRNFYYAGILTHTYLMYGFPGETLQETVNSLEVVRQLFQAELVTSAFWHRYAMTCHSSSGQHPERFGVRRRAEVPHPFANNEVYFAEDRHYNIELAGESLRRATQSYLLGIDFEKPVHKWFGGKTPATTHEDTLVADHLLQPDGSRLFHEEARLVWIGISIEATSDGLHLTSNTSEKNVKFPENDTRFLLKIIEQTSNLKHQIHLSEVQKIYAEYSEEPFLFLYHSKKWDILREYGLLQL